MPSTSGKQHRFMEAIAHNKAFAKKVGVPQSVGQDFSNADKGKNFKDSKMATKKMRMGGALDNLVPIKLDPKTGKPAKPGGGGGLNSEDMKRGGHVKKMANGGITSAKMGSVKTGVPSRDGIAEKGKTKGMMPTMKGSTPLGMKKGGMTKKMNMGGKAC